MRSIDFKSCAYFASNVDSNLVIRTQNEWLKFQREELKNCPDTNALDIPDFNQFSILALDVKSFACNVAYHRSFALDTAAKLATYTVKVERCGGCNTKFRDPNFVVVPKIPQQYQVKFIRIEE